MTDFHLAELNIGRLNKPLEAPETAEFTDALDRINALAEASPGFIWRLKDEDGNSSSYVELSDTDDPLLIANYSIWQDLESLKDFMYKTDHMSFLRRRTDWFAVPTEAITVCWWEPAGSIPSLDEAYDRLKHLREHGPSETGWPLTSPMAKPLA